MMRFGRAARLSVSLGLLCMAALAACAPLKPYQAYDGPQRAPDETALLSSDQAVIVQTFDGEPVETARLEILPGSHHLQTIVRYWVPQTTCSPSFDGLPVCTTSIVHGGEGRSAVTFDVEPGREYLVRGVLLEGRQKAVVWVQDVETAEVVGGRPPPEPD